MTSLVRTKTIIDDCEEFVGGSEVMGGPIESYLVQHALVILCAEIQQEIYEVVRSRADSINDRQIASFVSSVATRVLRSVRKDEIAKFVGHFGKNEKQRFNELLDDSDITRYNNAVNNRHEVAHRHGVQVTFNELKQAVSAAENILIAISKSIEV